MILTTTDIQLLTPQHWKDYELIDCGDFEKLERFGDLVLIRPEPQAVWPKTWSEAEWNKRHDIKFKGRSATSGEWMKKILKYKIAGIYNIKIMMLRLSFVWD